MKIFDTTTALAAATLTAGQMVSVKEVGEYRIKASGSGITLANGNKAVPVASGTAVNVKQFGAVGDGVADDTAAIQAALDLGGDIYFPAGGYVITAPLELRATCKLIGQTDPVNTIRNMVRILPSGNFAAFTNDSGGIQGRQYHVENFQIFWGYSTPTTSVGNDQKMGFYFTKKTASPYTAPYSVFKNIEVNGAWYVFYDDTDNYKNRLEGVVGRYNWYGFYKRLGTTFLFERCSNALGKQGFHIENVLTPMLIDCSADAISPDASTPGNAAVYLYNAEGFSLDGWDAEAADIDGDGYSYMRIRTSVGTVSNFTILNNAIDNVSGTVSFFNVTDSSKVTFTGIRQSTLSGTPLAFNGTTGNCVTLYVTSSASVTCLSSDFNAPTGGTPATRYSVYGNGGTIRLLGCSTDNTEAGVVFKENTGTLTLSGALSSGSILTTANAQINGNVGIGTTPTSVPLLLDKATTAGAGIASALIRNSATSGGNGVIVDVTNTPQTYIADYRVGNTTKVRIEPTGYIRGGSATGPLWATGTGSPEGVVTAPVGSFYSRTDGGAGTSFYVKESGTGNTGWVAK